MILAYSALIIALTFVMDRYILAKKWRVVAGVAIGLMGVVFFASVTANFVMEHRSYGYYRRY